jgi:hypothetical protein
MITIEEITKEKCLELVFKHKRITSILKELGLRSSADLQDRMRRRFIDLGIDYLHLHGEANYDLLNYKSKEELIEIIKDCKSFSQVFKKTKTSKDLKQKFIKVLLDNEISTEHFKDYSSKRLEGKKMGRWKVGDKIMIKKKPYWNCVCECGTAKPVHQSHLLSKKSLGCTKCSNVGEESSCFTGYKEISGNKFTMIKKGAEKRGLEFSVDIKELWELYKTQDRKCALTNMEIKFGERSNEKGTASLDRIDSAKGYVNGNIQWVHSDVNIMKNKYDQEYFISICKMIASNHDLGKQIEEVKAKEKAG